MDLHTLAELIATPNPRLRLRQGAVTAIAADGSITVTIAGSTTAIAGVKCLASVCPKVGAGVWLATDGVDVFALGTIAPTGPAYVKCVKSGDHNIATSSFVAVNWNSASPDTHGMWAAGASKRITAQVPGIYLLCGSICWASNETGDRVAAIRVNGDSVNRTYERRDAMSGVVTMTTATLVYPLAAGDYVELHGWQDSGVSLAAVGDERTFLSATWLRPVTS